ncbi:MAG: Ppx/GppA family phosphatase [Microscillaceae bacterium]
MQISRVLTGDAGELSPKSTISFKRIEYTRFALRLGKDVFYHQKITEDKKEKLLKLCQVFKLLMELHEVEDYLAFATSAFREAANSTEVIKLIRKQTGIGLEIIDGQQEAAILGQAVRNGLENGKNYLHIDVGGGSTELNFYAGRDKKASQSFRIGSIRGANTTEGHLVMPQMLAWVREMKATYFAGEKILAVGTGGNINKVHTLIKAPGYLLEREDIYTLRIYLARFTFKQKVHILKLNPDRADTILPATEIYLNTMESAEATQMLVPKVGLKDGMLQLLLQKNLPFELHDLTFI